MKLFHFFILFFSIAGCASAPLSRDIECGNIRKPATAVESFGSVQLSCRTFVIGALVRESFAKLRLSVVQGEGAATSLYSTLGFKVTDSEHIRVEPYLPEMTAEDIYTDWMEALVQNVLNNCLTL